MCVCVCVCKKTKAANFFQKSKQIFFQPFLIFFLSPRDFILHFQFWGENIGGGKKLRDIFLNIKKKSEILKDKQGKYF